MVEVDKLTLTQATFTRGHISILSRRIAELIAELDGVTKEGVEIQASIDNFTNHCELLQEDYKQHELEQEQYYSTEIKGFQKQNQRLRDIIVKKKEERASLLESLYESNICEKSDHGDLRDFDWAALERLASTSESNKKFQEKQRKLTQMEDLNKKARESLTKLSEVYTSAKATQDIVKSKMNELANVNSDCTKIKEEQEQTIGKLTEENNRLNLLLRQGVILASEPLSDYLSRHIREKCQSFLSTTDPEELMEGLRKFKQRQHRYIKLLKHKIAVLTTDINSLQIARDQTNDEADYYMTMIRNRRMRTSAPDIVN